MSSLVGQSITHSKTKSLCWTHQQVTLMYERLCTWHTVFNHVKLSELCYVLLPSVYFPCNSSLGAVYSASSQTECQDSMSTPVQALNALWVCLVFPGVGSHLVYLKVRSLTRTPFTFLKTFLMQRKYLFLAVGFLDGKHGCRDQTNGGGSGASF